MIVRAGDGWLEVVDQPDHGRHTALLAAAWGGSSFAAPPPALVEAAAHHDDGWLGWEPRPGRDGRPLGFMDLETGEHLALWRRGIARAEEADPYRALIVSRHAVGLYRRYFFREPRAPEEEAEVRRFLAEEERRQAGWTAEVAGDPGRRALVAPQALDEASHLLGLWDWLSLMLCSGSSGGVLQGVPARPGPRDVQVVIAPGVARLDPFPLREAVEVAVTARRIPPGPYADARSLGEALEAASSYRLRHRLEPRQDVGRGGE